MRNQNPTPQDLFRMHQRMQNSRMDEKSKEREVLRFAEQSMNAQQKEKLQQILNDKDAMQRLLQSEQAQLLMQKLKENR